MCSQAARTLARQALICVAFVLAAAGACAQDLEPRSYSNSPVGLNFLLAGYAYTEGSVAFDPAVPLTDAQLHTNTAVTAYAHSFGAWGKSAKFDVIVPYTWLAGSALFVGQQRVREVNGFGDPRLRLSINFFGAPALSVKEFAGYTQDVIVGASLAVTPPLGQYDASKLVNIGTNRWSIKPQLGFSKAWEAWIVEIAPGITFYTDNTDFLNGGTLKQDPLYSAQGHVVRGFTNGIWVALDGTFFTGGRTTINGIKGDTLQSNTRMGMTVALPVDRHNSIKLYASSGTSSRTGSNFNAAGIVWQYRWGAGF